VGPLFPYDIFLQDRKRRNLPLLPNLTTLSCPNRLIKFFIDSPLLDVDLLGDNEGFPSSPGWRDALPYHDTVTTLIIKYRDLFAWSNSSQKPLRDIYPNLKTLCLFSDYDSHNLRSDGQYSLEFSVYEWCREAPNIGLPPIERLEFRDSGGGLDTPDDLTFKRLAVHISITIPSVESIGMFELADWVNLRSSGPVASAWHQMEDYIEEWDEVGDNVIS
jgi:hypothetical protein